jgi:hypothetical protein
MLKGSLGEVVNGYNVPVFFSVNVGWIDLKRVVLMEEVVRISHRLE